MLLLGYIAIILLASLAGGLAPMLVRLTHKRLELAVSFVGGTMLGVGLLHMLPHAYMVRFESMGRDANASTSDAHAMAHDVIAPLALWLLAGFLTMFLLERFFCFHHHDPPAAGGATCAPDRARGDDSSPQAPHDHAGCAHGHARVSDAGASAEASSASRHRHSLTWAGAAIGLSIHSLIEGFALAASMAAAGGEGVAFAGFATFLAIALHKPFDSLTIGALLAAGERSRTMRHIVNVGFSLLIPVGVLIFHLGLASDPNGGVLAAALAFSAGTFLCIAMSDLLPELQFHQHDRLKLSAALLLGLAVAWGMSVLEQRTHAPHHHAGDVEHASDHHDPDHDHDHDH